MTYSIIAVDAESGAFGVAIQSHWFNVGRDSPWIRFGIGAVLTQASTDPSYGWRGLDEMASGEEPERALATLLSEDPKADFRQIAMMDADGRVAIHTGAACLPHAGHFRGEGWAVLGNLLTGPEVLEEMARVFPDAEGTLAERMVEAFEAAEAAGGDLRGRQSAALRISPGSDELESGYEPGIDISIADAPDPVHELRRLVEVDRAYRALRRGQRAVEEGRQAMARHQFELASGLRHGVEVDFWSALGLAQIGETAAAIVILRRVIDQKPPFAEVLRRLGARDPIAEALLVELNA